MKIACYSVQPYEEPMMHAWGEAHGVEITTCQAPLSLETLEQAVGCEGVCVQQMSMFERDLLEAMKNQGIRAMGLRSAGFNNIPLDVIAELGLAVVRVPAYSPSAIAEYSVSRLLELLRHNAEINAMVGSYNFGLPPMGLELRDQVIGVIGTGHIGRRAIEIYRGFGCEVLAYDLYPNPEVAQMATYVDSIEELVSRCDVLTLHVPASSVGADGERMISARTIAAMKDGAFLVNTARAEHVDQGAVLEAVRSGKLAGAVLDLFDHEVKYLAKDFSGQAEEVYPELRELIAEPRILVSGHLAFFTETAARNLVEISLDGVQQVLTTGSSPNQVG